MTWNWTSLALTSLVCGVMACGTFAFAQTRQTAAQSFSQLPQAQSDPTPGSKAAKPSELGLETTHALITPDAFERREGRPLRMPAEQIEAAKDRQSSPAE